MQKLGNPVPIFLDARGALMDGGHIYVGIVDGDPETDPVDVFWDSDLTIPATQPLRTIGGLIVNGTVPALAFIDEDDYSMRVTDSLGTLVAYSPSVFTDASAFQPRSDVLDDVAALTPTSFGLDLLELADQAALVAATGVPASLPLAGGSVTGNIARTGAGTHWYWVDADLTSGRVYRTANGASDPTSQPGDVWLEEEA